MDLKFVYNYLRQDIWHQINSKNNCCQFKVFQTPVFDWVDIQIAPPQTHLIGWAAVAMLGWSNRELFW